MSRSRVRHSRKRFGFSFSPPYRVHGISSRNMGKKVRISFVSREPALMYPSIARIIFLFFSFIFFFSCRSAQSLKFSLNSRSNIAITLRKSYDSCLSYVRPNRSTYYITSDDDKSKFSFKKDNILAEASRLKARQIEWLNWWLNRLLFD